MTRKSWLYGAGGLIFLALIMVFIGSDAETKTRWFSGIENAAPAQPGMEYQGATSGRIGAEHSGAAESPDGSGESYGGVDRSPTGSQAPTRTREAFLPFESRLMEHGGMSLERVGQVIQSSKFDEYLRQIREQAIVDPAADDLGALYRRELESMLDGSNQLRMGQLVCGLSICVGALHARSSDGSRQYDNWRAGSRPGALPKHSFLDAEVPLDGGVIEYRFFFSTDQKANSIHMRR